MIWANDFWISGKLPASPENSSKGWIYEVIRVIDYCPVFLTEHCNRLTQSIKLVGGIPQDPQRITKVLFELIDKESLSEGNIRIEASPEDGHLRIGQVPHRYPEARLYTEGIILGILETERINPQVKAWNPEIRNQANHQILENQVYEVLFENNKGELTEGSRSNIFGVQKNTLITPPLDQVLPGITRDLIIKILVSQKISFQEEPIPRKAISSFEGFFITGTSPGVLPVRIIEGQTFNPEHPIIQRLIRSYHEAVQQNILETVQTYRNKQDNDK